MISERINGSAAGQLRRRLLHHQLDWSPWLDRGLRPTSDHHVRMKAFINTNSDLYQDHGRVIHGARRLNVNIALRRPCCFSGQQTCIRRHRLLRWNYAELILQQPCKNFVEFRWGNPRSPVESGRIPIYRSPVESGRESGRV